MSGLVAVQDLPWAAQHVGNSEPQRTVDFLALRIVVVQQESERAGVRIVECIACSESVVVECRPDPWVER